MWGWGNSSFPQGCAKREVIADILCLGMLTLRPSSRLNRGNIKTILMVNTDQIELYLWRC